MIKIEKPYRDDRFCCRRAWGCCGLDGVSPYLTSTSRLASEFRGMDERPLQNSISLFETDPFYLYPQAAPLGNSNSIRDPARISVL